MIFHSADFIIFLLVVLAVYWLLGHRLQTIFLLCASYFFYCYVHHWFLVLILSVTVVNYTCGLAIEKFPQRKKLFLVISLVASLGMLGCFKYLGFFVDVFTAFLQLVGLPTFSNSLSITLPVGISFYTFQAIGYSIDVYRGDISPRKNFIDFALFISFFPQLVAGPIERASNLLPQVENKRNFSPVAARDGLFLLVWGFFKKLVIADNVAIFCNKIFLLQEPAFSLLWAGVFAFCIQIFADFSAYTDIARGTAKLLGFELIKNFDNPYISISPTDFWRRWHMSLSFWIRDYVYIPLGGSRVGGSLRKAFNLLLTFFLCGLWHGASWNFILWGLYYGVLILLYRSIKTIVPDQVRRFKPLFPVRILFMFLLTNIGWLFFRETDLNFIVKYITLSPSDSNSAQIQTAIYVFSLTLIYSLPLWAHTVYSTIGERIFSRRPAALIWFKTIAAALLFLGILTLRSVVSSDFIYFQF